MGSVGMTSAAFLGAGCQLAPSVLADRLEHREARAVTDVCPLHQTVVHQGGKTRLDIDELSRFESRYHLDRLACEAANKNRQLPQEVLRFGSEQIIGPG